MTEPWYTRLYRFLTGYSYADDAPQIHPPVHPTTAPPRPRVADAFVPEPTPPAKLHPRRTIPKRKIRKKRNE